MTAAIYVPLWPFGVAFIILCLTPDAWKMVRQWFTARAADRRVKAFYDRYESDTFRDAA